MPKILILVIISLIFSCNNIKKIKNLQSKDELALNFSKTINLHIDSTTSYKFAQIEVFETDSGTILFAYDRNYIKINFYNLFKDTLLKQSMLKYEGIDSFSQLPYSFTVISRDSILNLQQQPIIFYRINADADLQEKFEITTPPKGIRGEFIAYPLKDTPLLFDKKTNSILFWIHHAKTPIKHYKSEHSFIFDLTEKKFIRAFGDFPKEYIKAIMKLKIYSFKDDPIRIKKENKLFYSFEISPYIFVYNYETGEFIEQLNAQSKYINEKIDPVSFKATHQQEINNYNTQASYDNLLYDPYRDIFLRVVKHKQELRNPEGKLNQFLNASWSIMFFDKNFGLINEIKFEKNKYNFQNIYIIKDGLLISTNNPFNPEEKEAVLSFELFDINIK